MEWLGQTLPIIIYFLLIILLVVLVILGVKSIITIDKADKMISNIKSKLESINGVFKVVDGVADKISSIGELIVDLISNALINLFQKNKKNNNTEEVKEEKENE